MKRRLETYAVRGDFMGPKVVLSKESKHGKKMHKYIQGSEDICGLLVNKKSELTTNHFKAYTFLPGNSCFLVFTIIVTTWHETCPRKLIVIPIWSPRWKPWDDSEINLDAPFFFLSLALGFHCRKLLTRLEK